MTRLCPRGEPRGVSKIGQNKRRITCPIQRGRVPRGPKGHQLRSMGVFYAMENFFFVPKTMAARLLIGSRSAGHRAGSRHVASTCMRVCTYMESMSSEFATRSLRVGEEEEGYGSKVGGEHSLTISAQG